jgi:predicted ABC-type ATPase
LIEQARQNGYKVTLVFVGLDDPGLSALRVAGRVLEGGHDVPFDAIARRYPASLANLTRVLNLVDRFYLFDNSDRRRRLLAVGKDGRVIRLTNDLPNWISGVIA